MELVGMLRILTRHRTLVAVGVVLAALAGISVLYRISPGSPHLASRTTTSGTASVRVLIAAAGSGSDQAQNAVDGTLGVRAKLLADLMSTEATRATIARGAGVRADDISVVTPAMGYPTVPIPLAVSSSEAAATAPSAYVVGVSADGQVPIITIRGFAADAAAASRLTLAGVTGLKELMAKRSERPAGFGAEALGSVIARTKVDSPSHAVALIAFIVVLSLWCSAIVFFGGLRRQWKRARLQALRAG
jgi:hypothetical protein